MQVKKITQYWRLRLALDCPEQSTATRESIILWLLGNDLEYLETLDRERTEIVQKAMEYRYRILQQRYLEQRPKQAYHNLLARLSRLVLLRNKIRMWIAQSRDRTATVVELLQEVISELMRDRYLQQQMEWITKCTAQKKLQTALILATTEEYCLRPVRHQPLLTYRIINYLRRTQQGGLTKVPASNPIRLVSEEMLTQDSNPISLLNTQAIAHYQATQELAEQQMLWTAVKQELSRYLAQKLGSLAVQWLQLYLQGQSPAAIALTLNLEIKQVYRLRDKIKYHASRLLEVGSRREES